MRASLPKIVLAAASLLLVLALVWVDRDRTSPGALSGTHAALAELADDAGSDGCERCHDSSDMADDCLACHVDVEVQLEAGRGFHGRSIATGADECARCHQEHHGAAVALAGEEAFRLAGFAEVAAFDHAGLEFELGGRHAGLACEECHRAAGAPVLAEGEKRFLGLSQSCEGCHEDVHEGKFGADCASCHGQEHPFEDAANFVHPEWFPLVGGHARECARCHDPAGPFAMELVRGKAPRACSACHESDHTRPFLAGVAALARSAPEQSCALCHDAGRGAFHEDSPAMPAELHAASGFELARPHERARCEECHAPELATFAERYPGRRPDDCAACHGDPHLGEFAAGAFRGAACIDCHARDAFDVHSFGVEEHARTAFALTGAHVREGCDACHAPAAAAGPRDFRTEERTCEACHDDVHRGEFAARASARDEPAPGCADCHSTESFSDVERASFDHGLRTRFALEGAHARAECESCHVPAEHADLPPRRFGFVAERFPGPPERCDTCHVDVHEGRFDRAGMPASLDGRTTCARCHDAERFRGEHARGFDHGRFTGFALEGAHVRASCESCHGEDLAHQRALGRVASRFPGPSERCQTCHEDPHGGRFDRGDAPPLVDGRSGCARCHGVEAFRDVTGREFDHALWTGFELEKAHARAACEACHVPAPERRDGMRLGQCAGSACADCHEDPHAGQFAVAGSNDCARCHADTGAFATLDFDHDRDSRFALDARHAKLDCAACHRPADAGRRGAVVRYKPLGVACADCHRPSGLGRTRLERPDDSDPFSAGGVKGDDR